MRHGHLTLGAIALSSMLSCAPASSTPQTASRSIVVSPVSKANIGHSTVIPEPCVVEDEGDFCEGVRRALFSLKSGKACSSDSPPSIAGFDCSLDFESKALECGHSSGSNKDAIAQQDSLSHDFSRCLDDEVRDETLGGWLSTWKLAGKIECRMGVGRYAAADVFPPPSITTVDLRCVQEK